MHKMRGILLSAGIGLLASTVPMVAGAKTTNLPKSYRGSWYGYVSSEKTGKTTTRAFAKMTLSGKKMNYGVYYTTKASLKPLTWAMSFKVPVTVTKKVNTKTKKVTYRLGSKLAEANFATLSLVKVNVNHHQVTALREKIDGVGKVYAFRQPTKSHRWDKTLDLTGLMADY